jgi:hypothetical protein
MTTTTTKPRYLCAKCGLGVLVLADAGKTSIVRACSCGDDAAVIANASGKAAGNGGAIGR